VTARVDTEGGDVATKSFDLTIDAAPLAITSTDAGSGIAGAPYTLSLTATGGAKPYTWSVIGAMPPGLLQTGPSELGGTLVAGTHDFTIQVEDGAERTATANLTLVVRQTITLTSDPSLEPAVVDQPYSTQLQVNGGEGSYSFSLGGGTPPPGIEVLPDGRIAGTPTTAGSFAFSVAVTGDGGAGELGGLSVRRAAAQTVSFDLSLVVNDVLKITTSALANATISAPYNVILSAAGGGNDNTWVAAPGSLPAGMSLSEGGVLNGAPDESGSFVISFGVTDGFQTDTKNLTLEIISELTVTTTALPAAKVGTPYSASASATGGVPPYTWTRPGGSLPPGITFAAGEFSGTPTEAGTFSFTVRAAAGSQSYTRALSIEVLPGDLAILTSVLPAAEAGVMYSVPIQVSGGSPPYSFSIVGTPAVPVTISSSGVVSGTPDTTGTFELEVRVTDRNSNVVVRTITFPVADSAGLADDKLLNGDPELFVFGVAGGSNPPSQSVRISTPATPADFTVNPPAVGWR
jgi:hypothetical protein